MVLPLLALGASGCLVQPKDPESACAAASCGECIELSGCGWCTPRGQCLPGTSSGPDALVDCEVSVEYISSGWRYSECTSCAAHDNCADCHEDFCTWCGDGAGYCVSGSDDDACRQPIERRDGCGGFPDPDPDPDPVSCTNTCSYAGDGDCDDGGPGSDFSLCDLGTDCTDCGPR